MLATATAAWDGGEKMKAGLSTNIKNTVFTQFIILNENFPVFYFVTHISKNFNPSILLIYSTKQIYLQNWDLSLFRIEDYSMA